MKHIKTIDWGFAKKEYFDLGKTTSKFEGGFDRKILEISTLNNGQQSMNRYRGTWVLDCDGEIKISTAVKPYSTKCKGFDY
jgi:hypothetical protein